MHAWSLVAQRTDTFFCAANTLTIDFRCELNLVKVKEYTAVQSHSSAVVYEERTYSTRAKTEYTKPYMYLINGLLYLDACFCVIFHPFLESTVSNMTLDFSEGWNINYIAMVRRCIYLFDIVHSFGKEIYSHLCIIALYSVNCMRCRYISSI